MAKKGGYRSYVYWDEKIPSIRGHSRFDIKDKEIKKGQALEVQFDPNGFAERIRCRSGEEYHILRITDIILPDNELEKSIKKNRIALIKRGLITPIKGFDD